VQTLSAQIHHPSKLMQTWPYTSDCEQKILWHQDTLFADLGKDGSTGRDSGEGIQETAVI